MDLSTQSFSEVEVRVASCERCGDRFANILFLAGLLDAEGSFCTDNGGRLSKYGGTQLRVQLTSNDLDVITWAKNMFQSGKITHVIHSNKNWRDTHVTRWCGKRARELALLVGPYMSERRRNRIADLIDEPVVSLWNTLTYQEKLCWVSGYWEGEGSTYIHTTYSQTGRASRSAVMELTSTDRDSVDRVGSILGLDTKLSYPPKKQRLGHKPAWRVATQKRAVVSEIAKRLYPHLFSRRRTAIEELVWS